MKKSNKKGFTIVELVIVIAVIAILAAVLIPTFSGVVTKAKISAVEQEAKNNFKEAYAIDMSDGVVDNKDASDNSWSCEGYSATNGVASYTLTKNGYTVATTDSGKTWSTTPATTNS